METVGQRIKALRRVTKTSQKELGKFCGVSDVAVGYWESQEEIAAQWNMDKAFTPDMAEEDRNNLYTGWKKAVNAARAFK